MKDLSKEIITISGTDYTLFLNRAGIVAWEKFCKEELEEVKGFQEKHKGLMNLDIEEITDETNPFEGISEEELVEAENDFEVTKIIYIRLYWIMLYTEHKLSIDKVAELFATAMEDENFGFEKLVAIANERLESVNKSYEKKESDLKNLRALKSSKR